MVAKGNLKTCKNGHSFYKCSACPTCPVCEAQRKPEDGMLSLIGAPARRALARENIRYVEDLAKWTEKEILALHGVGPSTIPNKKILSEQNRSFKQEAP